MIERESVVTTLNFAAMRLAMWNAASPMPMTGAEVAHRAASSPVSSKQAMTKASASRALPISSMRPGTEKASSK